MCGIFAYINYGVPRERKFIIKALIKGLRRLEYRGYDSAGISIDASPLKLPQLEDDKESTSTPVVFKSEGKIDNLEKVIAEQAAAQNLDDADTFSVHSGIGHTRWATHGPPEARNSHPQRSGEKNEFVVVHNGIITNYLPLKEMLQRKGFTFESDTDTEVIPKLAKFLYDSMKEKGSSRALTFRQLVCEVMKQLEGAYALLFKSPHFPGELIACKRGSPLIMGIKEPSDGPRPFSDPEEPQPFPAAGFFKEVASKGTTQGPIEFYFASDSSAIVEHTKTVLMLEDDDVAHLSDGTYAVYRLQRGEEDSEGYVRQETVERISQTLELELEQIMKGEYDHFMQKEIYEQPNSIQQTMRGRIKFDGLNEDVGTLVERSIRGEISSDAHGRIVLGGIQQYAQTICRSRRIIFVACGTSFHAAVACRQIFEELVEIPISLELASDLLDREGPIFRDDTAVFISQSGETADTLEALKYARTNGAFCVGITNTVGSAIARATDCGCHINAGAEIGVASTKAYTSQVVALTMVALVLSADSMSKSARRQEVIRSLLKLPAAVGAVLAQSAKIQSLAEELKDEESFLVFGRGYQYATALEAALKVKEVALIHSEAILAGEVKHGPLALVDEKLPLIIVSSQDKTQTRQLNVIQQLQARQGRLIVVCGEEDSRIINSMSANGSLLMVPHVADCLQGVVNIIPLQLLSYHLTVLRGHNVDQPRNLAKSVTVE